MKLAVRMGNNEYIYRISKNVNVDKSYPFIIKTLLKDNISFVEKKEILEAVNFSKKDTLLNHEGINIYQAVLANVPVYTNEIYPHRNEFETPSESLDELMYFILSHNEVNLNKIDYDNEGNSILKMLVVFGLSKTLNKALSLLSDKEKYDFLNETNINLQTFGLSNNYSNHNQKKVDNESLMVLPVIGNNLELISVMCEHGLNINRINETTGRGLGFYLYSKKMILELEDKYDFVYDLNQTDFKGNVLKNLLKDKKNQESPIHNLFSTLNNEMTAFIDSKIANLVLSPEEIMKMLFESFKNENQTNFKKIYDNIAFKINYRVPDTDITLLDFLSCHVNEYSDKSLVEKLFYIQKDFELRKDNVDNGLILFNIITSMSEYSIKVPLKNKLMAVYNKNPEMFDGEAIVKMFLKSYLLIEKIFNTNNIYYMEDINALKRVESFNLLFGIDLNTLLNKEPNCYDKYKEDIDNIVDTAILYNMESLLNFKGILNVDEKANSYLSKSITFINGVNSYNKTNNLNALARMTDFLDGDFLERLMKAKNLNHYYDYKLKIITNTPEFNAIMEKKLILRSVESESFKNNSIKNKRL